ncbi:hypothetical protein [Peterkaempfera sp. SMS 1(5)a]|uniref:hypothetical protein n=1 Tax=Peterkaempfera podocarpi TaxID=3232308 RepID=UPI00366F1F84
MITGNEMQLPGWRGGDGNAAYLDKTLRHQSIEMSLNESVDGRTVFNLWLRAAVISFVVSMVPFFIGFLVLVSNLGGDDPFAGSGSSSSDAGFGWFVFSSVAGFVVFWLVLLVSRLPEPVGEWRVLLADRQDQAETVYATIVRTLSSRKYPIVPNSLGTRMTLSEGSYTAYVSVFNYGTSLYLGWMMWRSRRGAELLGQFIGDLLRGFKGENAIEHQLLRSEGARAMREAVHLACREGLMVAIETEPVWGGGGLGAQPAAGPVPPPPAFPPPPASAAGSPSQAHLPEQPAPPHPVQPPQPGPGRPGGA